MSKQILIIAATHGDEPLGLKVIKNLKKQKLNRYFNCLIANPAALKINTRFVETDLNRSYPGNPDSKLYEERLAAKNLALAKQYKYIIDIHSASQGMDDFIIIPRTKFNPKDFPIQLLDLNRIILWPDPKGPLSEVMLNSLELEFGIKSKKYNEVALKATNIVADFILRFNESNFKLAEKNQNFYLVYGRLYQKKFSGQIENLKDFESITIGDEKFYPLLTGQYLGEGIVCYKMKKIE